MIYFINKETKEHRVYKPGDVVDSRIWKIVEADADGWVEWRGESDSSPVPCATLCRIKLSDGCEIETMSPEEWSWSRGGDQHIIAYRPILNAEPSKPEPTEWGGEGLPPVGIRCKALRSHGWVEVYVVGYCEDGYCVFDTGSDFKGNKDPNKFRPIRSAEDEAVEAINSVIHCRSWNSREHRCRALYAAIRDGEVPGIKLEDV